MATTAARAAETANAFGNLVHRLAADVGAETPVRTGSLIVTIFGDAIAPHGGSVWLGSLIKAVEPFGIRQRSVRTAVFRLARDGWLTSKQIGRRSFYALTADGRSRFDAASRRIYAEPRGDWPGQWTLAFLGAVDSTDREILRKELNWQGFASLSATLLAHPDPDAGAVDERLQTLPGGTATVLFNATAKDDAGVARLVRDALSLDELERRYRHFLDRFRPVLRAAGAGTVKPADALLARITLIHEYRKILLRDPLLPADLLPDDWSGVAAYQLTRNIYRGIAAAAEQHLMAHFESADGPLPPAEPRFHLRFGGLAGRADQQ